MYYRTETTNMTDPVRGYVHVLSSTRDSLYVQWSTDDLPLPRIYGYKIRYQAMGSLVQQVTQTLDQTRTHYDITNLHEDTNYKVCVEVITNKTQNNGTIYKCIEASTATDSLSVALGSTFGAFLALAIIVMFVFLAKWQHTRKLRRQSVQVTPSVDSMDSMVKVDADYEMSDVSLHVHDDTLKMEFSSQSSATAQGDLPQANGGLHPFVRGLSHDVEDFDFDLDMENGEMLEEYVTVHEPPDYYHADFPDESEGFHQIIPDIIEQHEEAPHMQPPYIVYQMSTSPPKPTSPDNPPDVRPKEKALMDLTHLYANKKMFEQPQTQLRPNLSCNW